MMDKPVCIDFETHMIYPRPAYPPEPVGVAIQQWGGRPKYYAWGHPEGNNCSKKEGREILRGIWRGRDPILCHNAIFDLDVACERLDLALPPWHRIHCTQILSFLVDPEAESMGLKKLAHEHLGIPPSEEARLHAWLRENVPAARRKKNVGGYIAHGPVRLVAPYAKGDVTRTMRLYKHFMKWVIDNDVLEAYERERRLIAVLLKMEANGVPVNDRRVTKMKAECEKTLDRVEAWIFKRLRCGEINLDSRDTLADAIEEADKLEYDWLTTATGLRQTSYRALEVTLNDPALAHMLRYRSLVNTVLRHQLKPWSESDAPGKIFCQWNSTPRPSQRMGGRRMGARTGRLSSSPNFQNIARKKTAVVTAKRGAPDGAIILPRGMALPPLPRPRSCIEAPRGQQLGDRDYSQQELRILAHFIGPGSLVDAYRKNPRMDLHQYATDMLANDFNLDYPRDDVKATGFGVVYGEGIAKLSGALGLSRKDAAKLRNAYKAGLAGLNGLINRLKDLARDEEPFETWGGRIYWCEEPQIVKGELRTYEYKMLNTLIQGSAADHLKETMVQYNDVCHKEARLLINVHDELVFMAPTKLIGQENKKLKKIMSEIEFLVPMLSDGKIGRTWEACK